MRGKWLRSIMAALALILVLFLAAAELCSRKTIAFPPQPPIAPAAIVYFTPSGSRYHREGCGSISDSTNTNSATPEEAIQKGLTPCQRCEP